MDVLTDILGSLRLTGGVVIDAVTHGDWCMVSQFTNEHCAPYFPVPGNLIGYHYVRSGHLFAELNGQTVSVPAGAVVLTRRFGWAFAGVAERPMAAAVAMAGLCLERALALTAMRKELESFTLADIAAMARGEEPWPG